ncbi:Noc2p-Noc3p complex subunit Noc3 [Schizosaccharomyces cryophilus OY26]|uniref:Nucleolar complex-associated protein 3 n=1 Tax=Schizosaccharomyces cryophilus (strain OY26 / ATCC MYA-4695 / CBS 11777 / NBRC 106824 / NRRL Y48691) TaxID=653667 RepID=S9VY23_SCHCR|nr:Noc2p-Noc3p complex subunit Noc3 [Schizosaccharomyces cryophilus OY26]EPY51124.1 Noc2p-Noc3p complex subunit Noc3 [Schizosaccharomyces cryophilus OY26]
MAPKKGTKSSKSKVASSKIKNIKESSIQKKNASEKKQLKRGTKQNEKGKENKGKKGVPAPEVPERELTEEDFAMLDENPTSLQFLTNVKPEELTKKVEKGPRPEIYDQKLSKDDDFDSEEEFDSYGSDEDIPNYSNDSDQEQDYELRPRAISSWNMTDSNRLPIKTKEGLLHAVKEDATQAEGNGKEEEEEEKEDSPEGEGQGEEIKEEDPSKDTSVEEPQLSPKQQIQLDKEVLASLAQKLLEEPEDSLHVFKSIFEKFQSPLITIKKLSLLTALAVFQDLIPGYRIRPLSEEEQSTKLSKEVAQRWSYEQTFLKYYMRFIEILESILKSYASLENDVEKSLYEVAVRCVSRLIEHVPHFNYHDKLLTLAVQQISHKSKRNSFDLFINSLTAILKEDNLGRVSLDCVKLLSKMFKHRNYDVLPEVYDLFLHIQVLSDMELKDSSEERSKIKKRKQDRPHLNKKARKTLKETKEIEKEMKEAEAVISAEDRERYQNEVLKTVFLTYFKTLQARSKLLGNALEGLARLSHLINVEFFGDLLQVLRELVSDDNMLLAEGKPAVQSTREALLTVSTAFEIASAPGVNKLNLDLDLSIFIQRLYRLILPFSLNPDADLSYKVNRLRDPDAPSKKNVVNASTQMEMLLKCYQSFFFKSKSVSSTRLAAFSKRLAISSLQLPEHSSTAAIALLARLVSRYTKLHRMFTSEEQIGDGIYQPFVEDPELCKSSTAMLYETFLLKNHYSPAISRSANSLFKLSTE